MGWKETSVEIKDSWKFGKSMLPVKKGRWNLKRRDADDLGELLRENRRVWGWMDMKVEEEWRGSLGLLSLYCWSCHSWRKKNHGREVFCFRCVEREMTTGQVLWVWEWAGPSDHVSTRRPWSIDCNFNLGVDRFVWRPSPLSISPSVPSLCLDKV